MLLEKLDDIIPQLLLFCELQDGFAGFVLAVQVNSGFNKGGQRAGDPPRFFCRANKAGEEGVAVFVSLVRILACFEKRTKSSGVAG